MLSYKGIVAVYTTKMSRRGAAGVRLATSANRAERPCTISRPDRHHVSDPSRL